MASDFKKVIVYNYLYIFSDLDVRLKKIFKRELEAIDDNQIKSNFNLLHLSASIASRFSVEFSNNSFKLSKLSYKNDFSNIKLQWNLSKCIEFAKANPTLNSVLNQSISHLQKRENLLIADLLSNAIWLRNKLAHETFKVEVRGNLELLSDDMLKTLIEEDSDFHSALDLQDLDTIYKHTLTYYFYLKEICKLPYIINMVEEDLSQ